MFHKHVEKILEEKDLSPHDIKLALARGGHMARTATTSHSAKATGMGLHNPSQLMAESDARKAKATRQAYYRRERAQARNERRDAGAS